MRQRRPKSRVGIRHANPRRKAREFARCYHSHERVAFIQASPCIIPGCGCHSINAHVGSKGAGAGRKADYDQIAPLCAVHHQALHDGRLTPDQGWLLKHAAATEAAWQASQDSPYRSTP